MAVALQHRRWLSPKLLEDVCIGRLEYTHPPDSRSLCEKTMGDAAVAATASTRRTSPRSASKSKAAKARCFCSSR